MSKSIQASIQPFLIAFALWLGALVSDRAVAQAGGHDTPPPTLVTAAVLQARISEAEGDPELEAKARAGILTLYREAVSNLKRIDANNARADAFAEAMRMAPQQTDLIRQQTAALADAEPAPGTSLDTAMAGGQIQRELKRGEADLAAVQALRADLERQLAYQEHRPATIRQALAAAQEQQRATAASLQAGSTAEDGAILAEARRWSLETRYVALSTLIKAFDQELNSLPMNRDLIEARRNEQVARLARLEQRVSDLRAVHNAWRVQQASRAEMAAEQMLQTTTGLPPAVVGFAEGNLGLARGLHALSLPLAALDKDLALATSLSERTGANYKREQAATELSPLGAGLGPLLLEHRQALPDLKVYERKVRKLEEEIAAVNVQRLRHLDDAARFANPSAAVADLAASLSAEQARLWHDTLQTLVEQRQALLDQQLEAEGMYLERLRRLQTAERQLLEAVRSYDAFLEKHLFWLGTQTGTHPADFARLPAETRLLLASTLWSELLRAFDQQVVPSPTFWLSLLVSLVVLWKRRILMAAVAGSAQHVGQPARDSFRQTLRALVLCLLMALPLPLLLGVTGWLLQGQEHRAAFSHVVGAGLTRIALNLYVLLALREISLPAGLAVAHLQWPELAVGRLRRELGRLIWVFIPANLVGRLAMDLNLVASGGVVTRLALLVASTALSLFLYRVFHPGQGVLLHLRRRADAALLFRLQPAWFPVLVAAPCVILAAGLLGYVYSAVIVAGSLMFTLWLVVGLALLHALVWRWLSLLHRDIGSRSAAHGRAKGSVAGVQQLLATEGAGQAAAQPAYADIDLAAMTEDSRDLLRIAIALLALAGLYAIWSVVFPALGILDEVTLWHHTVTVDGEDRRLPITLADLGLTVIYLTVTVTLARRLPAVLDMILLQRFQMAAGSRYTVTTLTTYAIVASGTLSALHTIGAEWSQVQWLAAALGVGIGFGLQEIVANFISGLIILFERPVRVGDIVTVGDTDGVVTRIRIRATTIRNADRKELVVPNKEFITGRLLNWSLSDQITRVMVSVGVAYGTDIDKAHALMREAAQEHAHVLDDPQPILSFDAFADNSLTLTLRAFVGDLEQRTATTTDLHKAINHKFEQAGIVMAFPQRDLHFDPHLPLHVIIESGASAVQARTEDS